MPNPYADVLRVPGAAAFSGAGALARLPQSMVGIGTVLMVEGLYGSYAAAGRVSGVLVIAQALLSPQVARWVDRSGQRRVLLPMLALTTLSMAALVVAAWLRAPEALLWLFALLGGGSQGSYGSYVRARWSHVVREPKRLHTAYSLESAIDELGFIVGPVLATTLATAVLPPAGVAVAVVVGGAGALMFLAQRRTEPPLTTAPASAGGVGTVRPAGRRSAVLMPGMPVLAVTFVAMGTIFGASDVATVAFAQEHGNQGLSGLILAAFALGSLVAGLIYGALHLRSSLSTRFVIGLVALAAGVSLFLVTHSLVSLAAVMSVTGLAIAPTIINGNAMAQALVPPERLTEALAWVSAALGVGASLGSWLAGTRIEEAGAAAGFHVAMGAAWASALIALVTLPVLRRLKPHQPVQDVTEPA
ncbi:MFS transporter [Puerhibacterium puerhi]|uniref:MFS transporter n=1 Tax=Puerhibacterium puerhi TaxID=2692623 RepID=UPI001F1617C8|nr:MFS transporter [Puerhibacterium puerhi]